ncbi:MAG: PEP-CTERM sorting domain-containing protein [Gammaproteobacteria bacterium]|nr:PEP-CTERM sorting domain-containing protein [Gammaproteobacteria bacterium]
MNIRKLFFALCASSLACTTPAGPMVEDAPGHVPESADSAKDNPFAIVAAPDDTTQAIGRVPGVPDITPGRVSAIADPGDLVHDSSHLDASVTGLATPPVSTAPGISEPATLALLGAGLISLAMLRRRLKR